VQFHRECFDAMFAILDSSTDSVAILVYNALVFIIGILLDEKRSQTTGRIYTINNLISCRN
jgi:hypothetical protein